MNQRIRNELLFNSESSRKSHFLFVVRILSFRTKSLIRYTALESSKKREGTLIFDLERKNDGAGSGLSSYHIELLPANC